VPRKILLIRLRLIGDVILTTPAIRAIRRAHPDAHLTYLVEPHAAAAVSGNPHLDAVIVAPLAGGLRRWAVDARLAVRLRREGFDTVLDFHGGPRSSLLAWLTGAARRIGYDISGRSWMYTEHAHRPRGHRQRHSVDNQWDLVTRFDPAIPMPTPDADPVEMAAQPAAAHQVRTRLMALAGGDAAPYIVVHVAAGNEFRRWTEDGFAAVVEALLADASNRRIILTTAPAQAGAAETVRRLALARGAPDARLVVMCDLDLAELRSLLAGADLFIGGDSGPAHVAATTTVPMVVIFGPTTPAVWGPWRPASLATEPVDVGALPCRPCHQRHCEPGDFRCLRTLTAGAVVDAARRALARGAARRTAS